MYTHTHLGGGFPDPKLVCTLEANHPLILLHRFLFKPLVLVGRKQHFPSRCRAAEHVVLANFYVSRSVFPSLDGVRL